MEVRDEDFVRAIFKTELDTLCVQAGYARTQLEEELETSARRNPIRAWLTIQTILTVAGNASKILWGVERNKKTMAPHARAQLRAEAGVSDDWSLNSRDLRNAFEHLDEKVAKWAPIGRHYKHRWIDWNGPGDHPEPQGLVAFGTFDPKTWVVTFPDVEPVSLRDLMAEIELIAPRVNTFGEPLPPPGSHRT
jgi:hypothetical protein